MRTVHGTVIWFTIMARPTEITSATVRIEDCLFVASRIKSEEALSLEFPSIIKIDFPVQQSNFIFY